MERRTLLWTYLFGAGSFFIGLFVTAFCGFQIAGRVFDSGSRVGGLIVSGYSVGLFLWSTGWVIQFWGTRIRALEEKIAGLTVTVSAPLAMLAGKGEFTVMLKEYPTERKVAIIKVIREITGLGIKEAKDLVEGVPSTVKEGISKAHAEAIIKKFDETGAKVEIK